MKRLVAVSGSESDRIQLAPSVSHGYIKLAKRVCEVLTCDSHFMQNLSHFVWSDICSLNCWSGWAVRRYYSCWTHLFQSYTCSRGHAAVLHMNHVTLCVLSRFIDGAELSLNRGEQLCFQSLALPENKTSVFYHPASLANVLMAASLCNLIKRVLLTQLCRSLDGMSRPTASWRNSVCNSRQRSGIRQPQWPACCLLWTCVVVCLCFWEPGALVLVDASINYGFLLEKSSFWV